ncbi:hypothetical protein SNE40_005110 [Patella caerulea]|uniref:Uncharacterized protein n=1 Tax=Patella caerulea TaxID=87958 RepID=A0AAN8KAU4_PATCE
MTEMEVKAKNFLAASIRQSADLERLTSVKDTQTYRKVKEKILFYNPTLDDKVDLKFIETMVQKHLKYKRRSIRQRNPQLQTATDKETEEAEELDEGSKVKLIDNDKFVASGRIESAVTSIRISETPPL